MMQFSDSTSKFLQAVSNLYAVNSSEVVRKEADLWLNRFQLTTEAWIVVDEVLLNETLSENVYFLAAQTYNRKMRYDCEQLNSSPANWERVRSSLIQHLIRHCKHHSVSTQLSLALVALTIEMETWEDAIGDLIRGLSKLSESKYSLIEVLRLIPEDIDDSTLDVSNKRRYTFKNSMLDSTPVVIDLLNSYLREYGRDLEVYKKVFDCCKSWIINSDVAGLQLSSSLILSSSFEIITMYATATSPTSLKSHDLQAAVDLIIEVCHRYKTLDQEDLPVVKILVPKVFGLFDIFQQRVVSNKNEEDEVCLGIARIFCHMCEAYISMLISHPSSMEPKNFLNLALSVFSCNRRSLIRKSLYFWVSLLKELQNWEDLSDFLRAHREIFQQLIDQCVKNMMRTPREYNVDFELQEEEKEREEEDEDEANQNGGEDGGTFEFLNHRFDLGEVLNCLGECLLRNSYDESEGAVDFNFIVSRLGFIVREASEKKNWPLLEAALVAFGDVAMFVDLHRDSISGKEVESVLFVMNNHHDASLLPSAFISRVSSQLVASLAPHIANSAAFYLPPTVEMLIAGMRSPLTAKQSARAFRVLCQNPTIAYGLNGSIVRLIQVVNPGNDAQYSAPVRRDLMEAFSLLWSSMSVKKNDPKQIPTALSLLLAPILSVLTNEKEFLDFNKVNDCLDMLTTFVRYSRSIGEEEEGEILKKSKNLQHRRLPNGTATTSNNNGNGTSLEIKTHRDQVILVEEALVKVIPSLSLILNVNLQVPERIVESVTKLIKYSIRTWTDELVGTVPFLLKCFVESFQKRQSSAFLYITGVLLCEYSNVWQMQFLQSIDTLCIQCFNSVLTSVESFLDHPNIVEDLYYLANRTLENYSASFFPSPIMQKLVEIASGVGVLVDHREAFRSIVMFLNTFISFHQDPKCVDAFEKLLSKYGVTLLGNLIIGAAGGISAERVSGQQNFDGSIASVLYSLCEVYQLPHFANLVTQALGLPECAHLSNEMRGWFVERLRNGDTYDMGLQSFDELIGEFGWRARRKKRRVI